MAAEGIMGATTMQRKHRGKYDNPRPKSMLNQTIDAIKELLADGVKMQKKEIIAQLAEKGIGKSYVDEAKRRLNLIGERIPGTTQWTHRLPTAEEVEPKATVLQEEVVDPARTHHLCEDEFSVTVEERKRYGIRDDEQVMWIRDPAYWKGKVPGDPVRMFQRDNTGGRVIMHNGEFVTNGIDVILAVRPMAEVEKLRAREQKEALDIAKQRAGLHDDDFDRINEDRLKAQMNRNTQEHVQMGLIGPGSPSSGLAYEDYVRNRGLSKEQIREEEMRYSLRGASREYSREEYEEVIASQRKAGARGQQRDTGGKFFSLPANIRPRNLAAK